MLVRLKIDFEHPSRVWWESGGQELWEGAAEGFDATQVDATTLAFGPSGAAIAHRRGHVEDVDGDGDLDLLVHFPTQDTGLAAGQMEACLSGELPDGTTFTACDRIDLTPQGAQRSASF